MASKSKHNHHNNAEHQEHEAPKAAPVAAVVDDANENKIYRIEVTDHTKIGSVSPISRLRQSNQVLMVPYNKLFQEYQHIHRRGGVIASVTPVGQ
jgi:phycoerythrin-associated linker protein